MANSKIKMISIGSKKEMKRSFPIDQANKILKLKNCRWEIDDEKFFWNGKEVSKVITPKKSEKNSEK